MKILIIGPYPPPIYGVTLSNFVLTKGLKHKQISVESINTELGKKVDSEIGAFSFEKLGMMQSYKKIFKIKSADVVYTTPGQTFFGVLKYAPFILMAKVYKKPIVIHVKGGYIRKSYESLTGVKKKIFKYLVQIFDAGIVLSPILKPLLQPFLPEDKIFVQYNFIQDQLLPQKSEVETHKNYDELRVFYLSNLMHEKGIEYLINALENLNQKGVNFKAKIAGGVSKECTYLVEKMAKMPNVEYVGVVNGEAKTNLLLWGNLFCLPTFYPMEGQPISILESMAFGNYILTTKHAGITDVVKLNNGDFVAKKNAQEIEEKLAYLVQNLKKVEQIGLQNSVEAIEKYKEENFVNGILKILKHVQVR